MQSVLSLITPPSSSRLSTVATVRAAVSGLAAESDSTVERLIDVASAAITRHIGPRATLASAPSLGVQTVYECFNGGASCESPLVLSLFPVTAIDFIEEGGVVIARLIDDGAGGTAPNSAFAYEIDEAGLVWKYDGVTRRGFETALNAAQYTAGWVLPDDPARNLPYDIEDACIVFVRRKWEQLCDGAHTPVKQESFAGIGSWTYATETITWADGMPSDVAAMLARWRRRVSV